MSITTKKIRGNEYKYLDYYNSETKEKKTKYLAKKGNKFTRGDRLMILRIYKEKIAKLYNKLIKHKELEHQPMCWICKGIDENYLRKKTHKQQSFITVLWEDKNGSHLDDFCIDCLIKHLKETYKLEVEIKGNHEERYQGVYKEKIIGTLFLNKT